MSYQVLFLTKVYYMFSRLNAYVKLEVLAREGYLSIYKGPWHLSPNANEINSREVWVILKYKKKINLIVLIIMKHFHYIFGLDRRDITVTQDLLQGNDFTYVAPISRTLYQSTLQLDTLREMLI